ncbi:hypothetical protein BDR05DRAFT_1006283 [Suillus weaverae]|nr:hypothetical protein BDR05DRAFT_1006283 [Suillus weaverae]
MQLAPTLPAAIRVPLQVLPPIYDRISTISDADEDAFPLTPNSKHSGGAYNTYGEAGSRAPSCSSMKEDSDTYDSTHLAPTHEDRHLFDRLIGRSVDDQDPSETISQKAKDGYSRLTENLSANTFHYMIYYLEAVHEHK